MSYDHGIAVDVIARRWRDEVVPQLHDYIAIPALSPSFDPDWEASGHLRRALDQVRGWVEARPVEGLRVEVRELPGRTPLLVAEVAPFGPDGAGRPPVVLYGHLDKQPEMVGWRDGLGPWTPVREGDRLYGRGGADDGYAAYAALTAIEALQRAGGSHGRLLVLIEASEESGSPDLAAHVDGLGPLLEADGPGSGPDLVICLDSGCADYETLWLTTSLRGVVVATVEVEILTEGVHSGSASGVVPSSFRILRQLLDRIEDAATGTVLLDAARAEVPAHRLAEAEATAAHLGADAGVGFPFVAGAGPVTTPGTASLLARTWQAALSYVGVDGMPPVRDAGNVLRPGTRLKLSLRIPPPADAGAVVDELREVLESEPPYGAAVRVVGTDSADGWDAPDLAPWLRDALDRASKREFGREVRLMGEGGSIPFMGMLGERFPSAQFVITGVLGPGSNAHGPNEFLDLAYAERLTAVVAGVLEAHATRSGGSADEQGDHG